MRVVPAISLSISISLIGSSGLAQDPPLVPLPQLDLHPWEADPQLPADLQAARAEALILLRELYAVLRAALVHEPDQARINEVIRVRGTVFSAQQALEQDPTAERLDQLRQAIKEARRLLRSWYVVARLHASTGRPT